MKHNWTYRPFMECIENVKYTTKLQTKDFAQQGTYPIISQDESYISGYWDNANDVFHAKRPLVIFGDHTRVLKYIDFDFVLGADGVKILLPTEDILAKYMYYYLKWYNVPSLGYSRHFKLLRDIEFPIPSLSEQQAIVRELDGINRLIDLQEEQLREYDRLAQSLFYTTFGDPATNPKGWEVKKLGDIAEPTTGITYSPDDVADDGIIVLRSSNIQDNKLDFDDIVRVRKTVAEKYYVKAGDILMCSRNGSFRLVGKTALVDNLNEKMTWGAFMTIIRSDYNPYLLQYFRTPAFREQLTTAKTTTVNQITIGMLKKIQLPIPPANLQQSFAAQIEAIEQQKALIRRSLDETRTLLAARMQYYFE